MATLLKIWLTLATLVSSYGANINFGNNNNNVYNNNNNNNVNSNIGFGSGNIVINGVSYTSGDANSPYYSTNNRQYWKDGKCIQEINVSGRGMKDTIENACSNQGHSTLSTSNFLAIGDPKKNDMSLFTDSQGKLAVIRGGKCTLRTYTTKDGKTTHIEQPLDQTTCDVVKAKMAEEIEKNRIYWENWNRKFQKKMRKAFPPGFPFHKPNPEPDSSSSEEDEDTNQQPYTNVLNGISTLPVSNSLPAVNEGVNSPKFEIKTSFPDTKGAQCMVDISIAGKGVLDKFNVQCSKDGADSINRDEEMIFGNPKKNNFCLYSDAPKTLVVIKDKICTKNTYKTTNGVTTSTKTPMTSAKCSEIKQKMLNALENRGGNTPQKSAGTATTPNVTYRPVDKRLNFPSFSTTTSRNTNNGQCVQDVTIVGRGVNEKIAESCSSGVVPQRISTNNLLVMKGVSSDLDLYSDKWATLVVIRSGKCSQRKYVTVNGQTKITSSPMTDTDCNVIKKKMVTELEKGTRVFKKL